MLLNNLGMFDPIWFKVLELVGQTDCVDFFFLEKKRRNEHMPVLERLEWSFIYW